MAGRGVAGGAAKAVGGIEEGQALHDQFADRHAGADRYRADLKVAIGNALACEARTGQCQGEQKRGSRKCVSNTHPREYTF